MTIIRPIGVKGSCGHNFNILFATSLKYYLHPGFLIKLLSGSITIRQCPICKKWVIILLEFVVDTLEERILINPIEWKSKVLSEFTGNETLIFEEYGKPFKNLRQHLKDHGIIDEDGNLAENYVPKTSGDEMGIDLGIWKPRPD